jgi:hypothetical protein
VERVHEIEETADSQALPAHSAALEAAPVERVLALQRAVGNRAVSRMIARAAEPLRLARWSLPIQGGVPTGTKHTTSFATFINIIKDEEAKLPVDVQLNTKLMITTLRRSRRCTSSRRSMTPAAKSRPPGPTCSSSSTPIRSSRARPRC